MAADGRDTEYALHAGDLVESVHSTVIEVRAKELGTHKCAMSHRFATLGAWEREAREAGRRSWYHSSFYRVVYARGLGF